MKYCENNHVTNVCHFLIQACVCSQALKNAVKGSLEGDGGG